MIGFFKAPKRETEVDSHRAAELRKWAEHREIIDPLYRPAIELLDKLTLDCKLWWVETGAPAVLAITTGYKIWLSTTNGATYQIMVLDRATDRKTNSESFGDYLRENAWSHRRVGHPMTIPDFPELHKLLARLPFEGKAPV